MNITESFRRKNKYHKPIIVFKELYRDYFRHVSTQKSQPFKLLQTHFFEKSSNLSNDKKRPNISISKDFQIKPKLMKTKSAEQFSNYLKKYGQPGSTLLDFSYQNQSTLKKSRNQKRNTYVFRLLQRTQLQQIQKQKQSYFSNNYTKCHPFFQRNQNQLKQRLLTQKQNSIPVILPEIFKQSSNQLKKPIQKRKQLLQLKNQFNERKNLSMQKYAKIRHNFLLKKNFTNQIPPVKQKNTFPRDQFRKTKENIFPQAFI